MLEKIINAETIQKSVLLVGLGIIAYSMAKYIIESHKTEGIYKEMKNQNYGGSGEVQHGKN